MQGMWHLIMGQDAHATRKRGAPNFWEYSRKKRGDYGVPCEVCGRPNHADVAYRYLHPPAYRPERRPFVLPSKKLADG